jgi:hypothetical protein
MFFSFVVLQTQLRWIPTAFIIIDVVLKLVLRSWSGCQRLLYKISMIAVALQVQLKGIPTASTNCEASMIIAEVVLWIFPWS